MIKYLLIIGLCFISCSFTETKVGVVKDFEHYNWNTSKVTLENGTKIITNNLSFETGDTLYEIKLNGQHSNYYLVNKKGKVK